MAASTARNVGAWQGASGAVNVGAYQFTAAAGGATFMDGVMTEEEWYSWRRRRRKADHLFEWRNKKGPIY